MQAQDMEPVPRVVSTLLGCQHKFLSNMKAP